MGTLSPKDTYQILETLGHQPQKRLGQNFLIDGNIVRKSLTLSQVHSADLILEVGPGLGTLTSTLLEAGATVYAVEKDPTLAQHLQKTLCLQYPSTFHLLLGDALEFPTANLPKNSTYKIVANLPYAISTPWLEKILHSSLPSSMTLMLQKEAADRFLASPDIKTFGAISIFLQSAYDLGSKYKVSPKCFYPEPDVESTLIHLQKKDNPFLFSNTSRELIRYLFGHRRKQLSGLLKNKLSESIVQEWAQYLAQSNLSLQSRAENIPLNAWQALDQLTQSPGA